MGGHSKKFMEQFQGFMAMQHSAAKRQEAAIAALTATVETLAMAIQSQAHGLRLFKEAAPLEALEALEQRVEVLEGSSENPMAEAAATCIMVDETRHTMKICGSQKLWILDSPEKEKDDEEIGVPVCGCGGGSESDDKGPETGGCVFGFHDHETLNGAVLFGKTNPLTCNGAASKGGAGKVFDGGGMVAGGGTPVVRDAPALNWGCLAEFHTPSDLEIPDPIAKRTDSNCKVEKEGSGEVAGEFGGVVGGGMAVGNHLGCLEEKKGCLAQESHICDFDLTPATGGDGGGGAAGKVAGYGDSSGGEAGDDGSKEERDRLLRLELSEISEILVKVPKDEKRCLEDPTLVMEDPSATVTAPPAAAPATIDLTTMVSQLAQKMLDEKCTRFEEKLDRKKSAPHSPRSLENGDRRRISSPHGSGGPLRSESHHSDRDPPRKRSGDYNNRSSDRDTPRKRSSDYNDRKLHRDDSYDCSYRKRNDSRDRSDRKRNDSRDRSDRKRNDSRDRSDRKSNDSRDHGDRSTARHHSRDRGPRDRNHSHSRDRDRRKEDNWSSSARRQSHSDIRGVRNQDQGESWFEPGWGSTPQNAPNNPHPRWRDGDGSPRAGKVDKQPWMDKYKKDYY